MQAVVSSVLHLPLFVDGSPWLLSVEHEVAIVSVNVLTGPFNKFTLGFWGSEAKVDGAPSSPEPTFYSTGKKKKKGASLR